MSTNARYVLASNLAQFLRRNGEKVLNGSCKLSLTTSALCLLNSLFADILNHDWYNTEISDYNVDVVADVQFLYDFMKRTTNLKLFHGVQTLRGGVDLSHFSNLLALELKKIPAHLIVGLNSLSVQLRALICSRSIYLLKEILGSSSDEQNTTDVWTELKELNVSYNYLECLDSSLKSLPNLEILDLSHNNLRSTEEIEVLENLSFVNLSYNQLDQLPIFHSLSCRSLVKLYVRNNNLNDLAGLECLFNLEELDAGYNLLSEYFTLIPIEKLKALKMLNLEGNPLFFHKRHSTLIINYLHPNVKKKGLHLNGKFFLVPRRVMFNDPDLSPSGSARHQTSINTVVGEVPNFSHIPEFNHEVLKRIPEIPCRNNSDANSASSCASQNDAEVACTEVDEAKKNKRKSKHLKRKDKLRKASIIEPDDDVYYEVKKSDDSELPSHVKAKHALEARRLERGQSWLIPDNPLQKSILSFPKVPANTPVCNAVLSPSVEKSVLENELLHHFETEVDKGAEIAEKDESNEVQEMREVLEINANGSDRVRHGSKESDDIEVLSTISRDGCDLANVQGICNQEDNYDCDIYQRNYNFSNDYNEHNLESGSDEESEDSIFHVERLTESKKDAVFVNIGARYAKEKDVISGKVLGKLDLYGLKSVNLVTQNGAEVCELQLEFDTLNTSRQKRHYIFDNMESTEKMMKILQPYADAYILKESSLGALECLNCNSQFSKQVARLKVLKTKKPLMGKEVPSSSYDSSKGYLQEAYACPNCDSHILVEMESMPLPSSAIAPDKLNRDGADNVSGGSASSGNVLAGFFTAIKLSPLLQRKSSAAPGNMPNTNPSVLNSASNHSWDKKDRNESSISRNSSDVTLISNQSQNSFAVIPEPTYDKNLNTIVERDSQSSLSPPGSRNSTTHAQNDKINESHSENGSESGSLNLIVQNGQTISSDDKDFFSFTESAEKVANSLPKYDENNSSDSEVYLSPYKNVQSQKLKKPLSEPLELDESLQLLHILGEKRTITYDMFKELDHRLKLYLEFNVLGEDEQFEACLQSSIVPLSTGEEFAGLFMLSSKNAYVIKFLERYTVNLEQNEPLDKSVQIVHSSPLSHLRQIRVLLGNQGLIMAFEPDSHVYTLIIRDADICNSFHAFLADVLLEYFPETDKIQILAPSSEELRLLNESVLNVVESQNSEVLLHLFAFMVDRKKTEDANIPACIIVTHENIFCTKILYKKQDFNGGLNNLCMFEYANVEYQQISDLISLKVHQDLLTLEVSFLNESSTSKDNICWVLKIQTKSSLFSLVNILKGPWEEIFGISLPLHLEQDKRLKESL